MAVVFLNMLPFVVIKHIWSFFSSQGKLDIENAVKALQKASNKTFKNKPTVNATEIINYLCQNMIIAKKTKSDDLQPICYAFNFTYRSINSNGYLSTLSLLIKLMYICSVPFNVALISIIIGKEYRIMGIDFFRRFIKHENLNFRVS